MPSEAQQKGMNRAAFYDALRKRDSGVFGTNLSQGQVDGCEILIDAALARRLPLNDFAYCLATTYHETAHTMQPIHERGKRAYFDKYEPGTRIGKVLGNTVPGDGYRFRGRGDVQLTGRRNYALASKKLGVDFLAFPDRALEPKLAAEILFAGMEEGWFTGRDLSDFIDDLDEEDAEDLREFIEARRVVNGTDKARLIGEYALAFERALRAAGYSPTEAPEKPVDAPEPVPVPTPPAAPASLFAALIAWLAGLIAWLAGLIKRN